VRALTYGALFVGLLLVYLPASLLARAGLVRSGPMGAPQIAGMALAAAGAALAVWCILTFVFVGRGTPAPFDPPRRLVVRGPYRMLRNPMYLGATMALAGAALYYESAALLAYAGAFWVASHLFVVLYEEPTLKRRFPEEYERYRLRTGRWWP
jgi:protein-S-isoprenylcysteine O-methyltransferase Ste14